MYILLYLYIYILLDLHKIFPFIENEITNLEILPTIDSSNLSLLYTLDNSLLSEIYSRYCQNYLYLIHKPISNNSNDNIIKRKKNNDIITIGYITSELENQFIFYLIYNILCNNDKTKFKIILFTTNRLEPSQYNDRLFIKEKCHEYISLYSEDAELNANLIKSTKVSILVHIGISLSHQIGMIFAYHPCPIQVSYMNDFITHSNSIFQYLLSSPSIIISDYESQFINLPSYIPYISYNNTKSRNELRQAINLSNDKLIMGCFSTYNLITVEVLHIWFKILKYSKNAILLLIKYNNEGALNILKEATKYEVNDQVLFLPPINNSVFNNNNNNEMVYNYCKLIDIYMDTTLGINCTYLFGLFQCFCPIISVTGKNINTQIVWSMYKILEIKDLQLYTMSEYFEKALHFTQNYKALNELKNLIQIQITKNHTEILIQNWIKILELKIISLCK